MRMRDTLAQIAANRPAVMPTGLPGGVSGDRLTAFDPGGSNPGALGARSYVPPDLTAGAPLVVVLHGCTQTAADYDIGSGWSHLAERAGFALLFPEQRRANNPNLCFNWFQGGDIARAGGEAESIAQSVEAMVERHALDRSRVFITGLSAGGAMTAVMLATYPDVFAGGAIIGGLPYGTAIGVGQALERMAGRGAGRRASDVASRASGLTPDRWPSVSIWHGSADQTVVVGNMDDLAAQWREVHGVTSAAPDIERGPTWERQRWSDGSRTVVETWRIGGMGHGVPIDPAGAEGLGTARPYMLAVGVDSTAEIARSWGLIPASAPVARPGIVPEHPSATAMPRSVPPQAFGIQTIIDDALRSAGLMK